MISKLKIVLVLCLCGVFLGQAQTTKIASITIKGAQKTKPSFIAKILEIQVGQPLDSTVLHQDILRLKRLPAISFAYYTVKEISAQECAIDITIEENYTLLPDLNFWTTTNNVFSYKLGLYDYNLLGRNITFGGFYQYNGFHTYALNFRAPNLFSRKWGVALNHQNWKSEEPLYFNDQSANYLYNS